MVLPERVTVALAELAGAAREGPLSLAVGTGLGVLDSLLNTDVDQLVGPKGRHQPDRAAGAPLPRRELRNSKPLVRAAMRAGAEVATPRSGQFYPLTPKRP